MNSNCINLIQKSYIILCKFSSQKFTGQLHGREVHGRRLQSLLRRRQTRLEWREPL